MNIFIKVIDLDTNRQKLYGKEEDWCFDPVKAYIEPDGWVSKVTVSYDDFIEKLANDGWKDLSTLARSWNVVAISEYVDNSTITKYTYYFENKKQKMIVQEDYNRYTMWGE